MFLCRNCRLYIIIQKIASQAESGKYFEIWFFPRFRGKNGGVLSMRVQVILDSLFARPGSAPTWESLGTGLAIARSIQQDEKLAITHQEHRHSTFFSSHCDQLIISFA